jgi:hypothetical protein
MTTITDSRTPVDPRTLAHMSRRGLDELFRRSPPGPIPAGRARGTAMAFPGSIVDGMLGRVVRALWWKGKVFDPKAGELRNLIGPLGYPAIRARVYQDQSWFADGPAIILDYSRTSFVAQKIRDEIRQVGPGLYLGQVYWGKRRVALFMLEFPSTPS